ncbi:MAG: PHP domain-containing protein [Faecalibacterium sp.]|nr:PHP domain-containing protein [Ruminococcus sp.]MCM1391436.1 PHP domain-containing protein [Ruminococcus sp.]MCM1485249.1 PHP domain-containing protein [Faecalibacterium sp.]
MIADLHCHTKLSDGTMGIDDIIQLARKSGIKTLAITDHDCLAGTVRAQIIGKRFGINVIPAVELTCTDKKRKSKAHMLCYYPDTPERLEGLCKKNSTLRKAAGKVMAVRAAEKFPISAEFIVKCATGSTNIFKQHIMQALLESGYTTTIFGELFDTLFKKSSPDNILVNTTYTSPEETLEAIHEAGGIAVLAHPGFYDNFELLDELIELGLDGVEVWHPENTPEQQEYLKGVAKKHKLLMTGGSDFHGGYNAYPIRLGDYGPPEDCVEELMNYKAKMHRKQKKLEKNKA